MTIEINPRSLNSALAALDADDPGSADGVMSALWSLGMEDETEPFAISRLNVQHFAWSTLPRKYIACESDKLAVVEALARFFDELGDRACDHAALCRSVETKEIVAAFERSRDAGFKLLDRAIKHSGLEAPNLPDFEWGEVMGLMEAIARDAVEDLIDDAIDAGELTPGSQGFKKKCVKIARDYMVADDVPAEYADLAEQRTWIELIRGERLEHRLTMRRGLHAELSAPVLAKARGRECGEARLALLRWLLTYEDGRLPLTATGNLNRALVRAAVGEFSALWRDDELGGQPQGVDDVPILQDLAEFACDMKFLRKRRGELLATPIARESLLDGALLTDRVARHLLIGDRIEAAVDEATCTVLAARRSVDPDELARLVCEIVADSGWHHASGAPIEQNDLRWAIGDIKRMLDGFGALKPRSRRDPLIVSDDGMELLERALLWRAWGPVG